MVSIARDALMGTVVRKKESGQIAVLIVVLAMLFTGLAGALIDVYVLLEARNWAYQAAQQAALVGVSKGREWSGITSERGCLEPMTLNAGTARSEAESLLQKEMNLRGISDYDHEVRVLPGAVGGSISGFPPETVRLGEGRGGWSMSEPSVGIYLSFPVQTFLMSFFGRPQVQIDIFAAGSIHQPANVCP